MTAPLFTTFGCRLNAYETQATTAAQAPEPQASVMPAWRSQTR